MNIHIYIYDALDHFWFEMSMNGSKRNLYNIWVRDVDGVTRKVLSNLILKAYKNFISVKSSKWWVYGDFLFCVGGRVEYC